MRIRRETKGNENEEEEEEEENRAQGPKRR